MRNLFAKLWADDAGIVTIEYLVLGTFLALALIVGVTSVATAVNSELQELANTILTFDQSYSSDGYSTCNATKAGSAAQDTVNSFTLNSVPVTPTQISDDPCL